MLAMPSDSPHTGDRVFVVAIFDCESDAIDLHSASPPVIGTDVDMLAMVVATPTADGSAVVESWHDPGVPAATIADALRRAADGYSREARGH